MIISSIISHPPQSNNPIPLQNQHCHNHPRHQHNDAKPKTPTQPRPLFTLLLLPCEPRVAGFGVSCDFRPRLEDGAAAAAEAEGGRVAEEGEGAGEG
jgi:hypothetical protein